MPNWKEIQKEWEATNKTYKELEEQFNVKSSTIRSRKNREKWQRNATVSATQQKNVATKKEAAVVKNEKKASSNGQKNRGGNPNPKNQFTKRNSAALKHGFFSKYIPEETLEIMGMLDKSDPADLIWDQIQIQYAAIIRSQQIMYVNDISDMSKEVKKDISSAEFDSKEYEIQFAWDKQASFLNAQSRAISELRTSIRQFVDMTNEDDERRLKLEQMQHQIDKTKAETEKITKEQDGGSPPVITIVDEWSDASE
ncbi:phage terminase small subunit [Oceanobacillus alkalisoli]|uniref:phage terminase small subunit n=1 Tax=Oceanobacillus alkalisoli TaxID=2925113 RepID=UPI001F11947F|nr:phage terminase small subunit [Oceanobacillus alkalisoli]MCF3942199.1 phage terminase small subunit [Oceanobacillus alkalisoli]